jgi:helicase
MSTAFSTDHVTLIPTSIFKSGEYKFQYFNLLQSAFFPFHDVDCNVVISAATSAGKTICAELSITDQILKHKKAIYLCPLKALSSEKYDDWTDSSHHFSKYNVEIITGDHKITEAKIKKINQADIIIMTSEMLDTRTRFANSPNNQWLKDVGIVVVDEAHLLTTERGPSLEIGLMRFAQINPTAKMLLLSATMTNYHQLADWIEDLNKKPTKCIHTTWRPVELHKKTINSFDLSLEKLTKILTCNSSQVALYLTSNNGIERVVAQNRMKGGLENTKTLIFVHTKKVGQQIEETLNKLGIKALFHSADLDKTTRNKLEKQFRDDLDVLVSTSTLAWGVNLPARNIIIVGDMRGLDKVSDIDIAQMCGRCGRYGMYHRGDAYFLDCSSDRESFSIQSQLQQQLGFHIIAEIYSEINTEHKLTEWLLKSLLIRQVKHSTTEQQQYYTAKYIIQDCLRELEQASAIKKNNNGIYTIAPYGKIARDLYLDPRDISQWAANFHHIEKFNLWDNPSEISRALAEDIREFQISYIPQPLKNLFQEFSHSLKTVDITRPKRIQNNGAIMSCIYYRLTKEKRQPYLISSLEPAITPYLQLFLSSSGRIFNAIKRISTLNNWDRDQDLEIIKLRIIHGVGKHLIDLVTIPGIGGTIATQLYKAGLKNLDDIIKNKDNLGKYIERKQNVTRILNGIKQLQENELIDDNPEAL